MSKVSIPTPLRSYTDGRREVDAQGATLDEVLRDLDRRHPGIRFRMVDEQDALRPHIRVWISLEPTHDLHAIVREGDEVVIIQALSGG